MKKLALIGLAFCLVFAFTVPAMALDVDFSGFYRVRGFCYHDYESFGYSGWYTEDTTNTIIGGPGGIGAGTEHASTYYDMLLDVNIVFTVHPKLKLITNFTALDKTWGAGDKDTNMWGEFSPVTGLGRDDAEQARQEDNNDIDWNQAYMEFITDIGLFRVGRMTIRAFEHPFLNSSQDADRILYMIPPKSMGGPSWNPFLVGYTFDKLNEGDAGTMLSDDDMDQHSVIVEYLSPNFVIGNLFVYYRDESSLLAATPAGNVCMDKQDMFINFFYTMLKFGPMKFESEISYLHGYQSELRYSGALPLSTNGDDVELDAMAWMVQATYDQNPVDAYIGWAHTDGDADGGSDIVHTGNTNNSYKGQFGQDWDLLFFLTSDEGSHAATFGGMGNWSSVGNNGFGNPYGLDLLYIGGGFDITPSINISGIWGLAWADAVPSGSKDVGQEINLWLTWKMMDGLQYKALFAFFDAGDFWEDAQTWGTPYDFQKYSTSDDGSCWALMHQLTLSF